MLRIIPVLKQKTVAYHKLSAIMNECLDNSPRSTQDLHLYQSAVQGELKRTKIKVRGVDFDLSDYYLLRIKNEWTPDETLEVVARGSLMVLFIIRKL
jgi:hypothetical protein